MKMFSPNNFFGSAILSKNFFSPGPVRQNTVIIIIVFVFLALVSYYWFFPVINRVEEGALKSQRVITLSTADLLSLFLDFTFNDLVEFGAQHLKSPETHDELHEIFLNTRKDFLSIVVLDMNGVPVELPISKNDTANFSFWSVQTTKSSAFFREALEKGRYISPVFFGAAGPTLFISAPIQNNGELKGVVAAEIDFSLIREVVNRAFVESGKIYLVDDRGSIISDPDPERARSGENLKFRKVVGLLVSGEKQTALSEYVNENKKEILAYGTKMPSTGWGIIVEQLKSEVLKQKNQTLAVASTFAGASFILVFLIAFSTARLIKALSSVQKEREERDRTIAYLPDGVIEYTGENRILAINPAAKQYLNISEFYPSVYVSSNSAIPVGLERLWDIFFPRQEHENGQGGSYEITFEKPEKKIFRIITVYIKGGGFLEDQRYLKIIHDVTHERPL